MATDAAEKAQQNLVAAQTEVNRVATQAEMLGEQLSEVQEAAE